MNSLPLLPMIAQNSQDIKGHSPGAPFAESELAELVNRDPAVENAEVYSSYPQNVLMSVLYILMLAGKQREEGT